jgi:hypothetical protein
MTTQSAIVVQEPGRAALCQDVAIPELPEDYILVKTKAGMSSCHIQLSCPLRHVRTN